MVLKATLVYNKALWVIQKEMCMDGTQARTPSGHALHYAKDQLEQEPDSEHFVSSLSVYFIGSYIQLLFKYGAFLF